MKLVLCIFKWIWVAFKFLSTWWECHVMVDDCGCHVRVYRGQLLNEPYIVCHWLYDYTAKMSYHQSHNVEQIYSLCAQQRVYPLFHLWNRGNESIQINRFFFDFSLFRMYIHNVIFHIPLLSVWLCCLIGVTCTLAAVSFLMTNRALQSNATFCAQW